MSNADNKLSEQKASFLNIKTYKVICHFGVQKFSLISAGKLVAQIAELTSTSSKMFWTPTSTAWRSGGF